MHILAITLSSGSSLNSQVGHLDTCHTSSDQISQAAKWLSPDVQFSKVIDEKKQTMSLETWSRNESDMWSFLVMSLIKWGTANQRDGRSTLNVSFKLPPNLGEPPA